jgi:hypothetical protein
MTPVKVLQERRDTLMANADVDDATATQQEANAAQYRKSAAVYRQQAADLDAAILSLQQPWKAAPVPEAVALREEIKAYAAAQEENFEQFMGIADKKLGKTGKYSKVV